MNTLGRKEIIRITGFYDDWFNIRNTQILLIWNGILKKEKSF